MACIQFANEFANHIGKISTMPYMWEKGFIAVTKCDPINAMKIGVVEEVAHLAPALVVNLFPFSLAIELHFHSRKIEEGRRSNRSLGQIDDCKFSIHRNESFFAISSDIKRTNRA